MVKKPVSPPAFTHYRLYGLASWESWHWQPGPQACHPRSRTLCTRLSTPTQRLSQRQPSVAICPPPATNSNRPQPTANPHPPSATDGNRRRPNQQVCIEELKRPAKAAGVRSLPYVVVYDPPRGKVVGINIPPSRVKNLKLNLQVGAGGCRGGRMDWDWMQREGWASEGRYELALACSNAITHQHAVLRRYVADGLHTRWLSTFPKGFGTWSEFVACVL